MSETSYELSDGNHLTRESHTPNLNYYHGDQYLSLLYLMLQIWDIQQQSNLIVVISCLPAYTCKLLCSELITLIGIDVFFE